MKPYYRDDAVTLHHGDSVEILRDLPTASVDSCVTSPPYFGLRDYGQAGQYGLEDSPTKYVETMTSVFSEVRRVLADDGTLWLNLGDSYATQGGKRTIGDSSWTAGRSRLESQPETPRSRPTYIAPKNLLGIPWRVAFALQDSGWILRSDIIWAKTNGMPESVKDRVSARHEHVFMFSKNPNYWFDLDPIREPVVYPAGSPALSWSRDSKEADVPGQSMRQHRTDRTHGKAASTNLAPTGARHDAQDSRGRNPGDVWALPTQPFSEAHFAVMPTVIAERCISAGCKPGGVVLDPFSGSGTTGLAAARLGRRYVGIDLNSEYLDLSLSTRLAQKSLLEEGA